MKTKIRAFMLDAATVAVLLFLVLAMAGSIWLSLPRSWRDRFSARQAAEYESAWKEASR